MPYEDKVYDSKEERIKPGTRVQLDWDDDDGHHHQTGVVDHITDAEGDVDDEGRPYAITPCVFVRWDEDYYGDDFELEKFSTHGHSGWYECDELEVVK